MPVLMGGPLSKTQRGRGEYPNTNRHTTMWNFAVTHTNLNGILLHLQTAKPTLSKCLLTVLLKSYCKPQVPQWSLNLLVLQDYMH